MGVEGGGRIWAAGRVVGVADGVREHRAASVDSLIVSFPHAPRPEEVAFAGQTLRAALDSLPAERLWDYPAGEWRLVQKAVGYDYIIVNGVIT